jgi:nucleoside-diphosphate-sugar epimerase
VRVKVLDDLLAEGKIKPVMAKRMPHTYTYTKDFAKGLVTLGTREEALGQVWHTPNAETLTTRELLNMIYKEAGQPPKFRAAPKFILTLMGLFNPVMREVKEMIYQFEMPFIVDHSEYDRVFGDFTPTPHEEAIRETMAWFRERMGK